MNDFTDSLPFGLYDILTILFTIRLNMINKDLLLINHLTIINFSTKVMLSRC